MRSARRPNRFGTLVVILSIRVRKLNRRNGPAEEMAQLLPFPAPAETVPLQRHAGSLPRDVFLFVAPANRNELQIRTEELDSLLLLVRSQLDVSIRRLLSE